MSEFTLNSTPPLGCSPQEFDGATLAEIADRTLISISVPHGGDVALTKALSASYKMMPPAIGKTALSKIDNARFLGLQSDQMFLLSDDVGPNPTGHVAEKLGDKAYLTDQSDSWAIVALNGPRSRELLERLSMIDLSDTAFPVGAVARTAMDHIGVIVLREQTDAYVLLSPRSSAASFLELLETVARNTL